MHIEFLVEDASGEKLLTAILPKVIGECGNPHTWRLKSYRGIGRLPKGLKPGSDPGKRILLEQLPRLLKGFDKTPGIDAVVIVLDSDRRDCAEFLEELKAVARECSPRKTVMFRLAIEESEAWYFGDRDALLTAYPRARIAELNRYRQDRVCGTWELLADAIYPGGSAAIKKKGWPLSGQIKGEWAGKIGPLLDPDRNVSPSFGKFRDGLRRLVGTADQGSTE